MKAVIGLGNPGSQYTNTRHNVGFKVIDSLADLAIAKNLILVKPQTYMNRSGQGVREAMHRGKFGVNDLLIVSDDAQLELGRLRFRSHGTSGGQLGVQSVIDELQTDQFNRLRIGIGQPKAGVKLSDYVLQDFKPDEHKAIDEAIIRACEAIEVWLESGIEASMNRFNAKEKS